MHIKEIYRTRAASLLARPKSSERVDRIVKNASSAIDEAFEVGRATTGEAERIGRGITKRADEEAKKLLERGQKRLNVSISSARGISGATAQDLNTLERLGELRDSGVLTEQEFAEQKKKILDRL